MRWILFAIRTYHILDKNKYFEVFELGPKMLKIEQYFMLFVFSHILLKRKKHSLLRVGSQKVKSQNNAYQEQKKLSDSTDIKEF